MQFVFCQISVNFNSQKKSNLYFVGIGIIVTKFVFKNCYYNSVSIHKTEIENNQKKYFAT